LETILKDSNGKFRRVILVEYPRQGIWAIAFVTGTMSTEIQAKMARPMLSIFIPTTPNPTTGWYAIVPEDEVINLAMPIEDAFKVIISGGIVSPTPSSLPIPLQTPFSKKQLEQPIPDMRRQVLPTEES
jgi:uncharacterized membrane protein